MVKIEQTETSWLSNQAAVLPEVRFENPKLKTLGIESMTMTELRGKVSASRLNRPERIDFYLLMLVWQGSGTHTIDFIDWPLSSGHLLFIQPGQVQQWHADGLFDAQLVLIDPKALPYENGQILPRELGLLGFDDWDTDIELSGDASKIIQETFLQLRQDIERFSGDALDIALIRHCLMTLLIRVTKYQKQRREIVAQVPRNRLTYRLFVQALEASFMKEHSLQYYASRLGYAESTLSRACLAAEGRSAKEVISRRVILEAKRLLAHSTASVAEVAHQLGFSEATNFVKFFRRNTGETPTSFRRHFPD